jgi:cellulose synthase/poly-beta-1,6-N-acetylglucosamine synthase-like glycosyltransferase
MTSAGRPSAGIAMCVYNGARYLQKQLDSISAQTERPKSMVIIDDGSDDGSWDLLTRWAANAPLPVRMERNRLNVGVVRNFERACGMVQEDIVFLADQDDLWYPDKLVTFVDRFVADPALGLLHSDADLIDDAGRLLRRRLFDTLLVTDEERRLVTRGSAYKAYAKRNLVTGASCAFRRELLTQAIPFADHMIHDEWLAFVAALASKVEMLETCTMAYRLHGANSVGLPLTTFGWRVRTTWAALTGPTCARQRERAQRLDEVLRWARRTKVPQYAVQHLQAAADHAHFRAELPANPWHRLRRVLQERRAGCYQVWSNGLASMLHDLLLPR